jgi:flagellar motor switch protein FliM
MENRSLNQDEVELLLRGAQSRSLWEPHDEGEPVRAATGRPTGIDVTDVASLRCTHEEAIERRSEVPEASLKLLEQLQRQVADQWSLMLEKRLKSPTQVRLLECHVCEYGEYVLGLERPTTFQAIRVEPLSQVMALEIPPSVIFPLIDRLLGGGLRNDPIMRRPLTEIELRLLRRLTEWLLQSLVAAWADSMRLTTSVESVDCNPRTVRCFAPSTRLVVCHFELDMRHARGPIRMAFAADSIAELEALAHGSRRGAIVSDLRFGAQGIRVFDDHAELAVVVAEMMCSVSQLADLQVGDLIQTDSLASARVQVRVDDETVYLARPGQYHGKRAFRIEQRVLDESG